MLIPTFTNSLCCMILNWYSHNVSGIYIHYRDYKSFCLIVIWKGTHYVNTDNIPGLRAFNSAFGKVSLFIIFSQLAFRACANYLTALFPPFGCNKFPVKGLPGLVFAKMTLPVDFLDYFFCLSSFTCILPSRVKVGLARGNRLRPSTWPCNFPGLCRIVNYSPLRKRPSDAKELIHFSLFLTTVEHSGLSGFQIGWARGRV